MSNISPSIEIRPIPSSSHILFDTDVGQRRMPALLAEQQVALYAYTQGNYGYSELRIQIQYKNKNIILLNLLKLPKIVKNKAIYIPLYKNKAPRIITYNI
jgi:hypothetical protein